MSSFPHTVTRWPNSNAGRSWAGPVDHSQDREPLPESSKFDAWTGFAVGAAFGAIALLLLIAFLKFGVPMLAGWLG